MPYQITRRDMDIALNAGYNAARENRPRAPVLCPVMNSLIKNKDFELGGSSPIFQQFLRGYEKRVDEECKLLMAAL